MLCGFNCGVPPFYTACPFDDLSRGSVSCLLNASFEKQLHNATTRCFAPKLMTMASARAIRGKYLPDARWWHPVASRVALDLPYRAMRSAPYRLIGMAIKVV